MDKKYSSVKAALVMGAVVVVLAFQLIALPQPQSGGGYDLDWHTVDGGGVMFSTGGDFELSGTIGQPDAGGPLTGGDFELTGGFWAMEAEACFVESTVPPDCAIDARQPSEPDGGSPAGWNSFEFAFNEGCNVGAMGPGDFVVTVTGGTAPSISDVTQILGRLTLQLDRAIPIGEWTCIEHTGSGTTACAGWLPNDVSGNGTSAAADIPWLMDCLDGVRACEMWQCDADRSGQCQPADVLRAIDLLNGAGEYEPWLDIALPACPSGP
jgi:hypothetical protein